MLLASLAACLTLHRVEYAVIGGMAMARWDGARIPDDLDVVLGERHGNGDRFLRALVTIERRYGLDSPGGLTLVAEDLEAGAEAEIRTAAGRIDVIGRGLAGPSRRVVVDGRGWWFPAGRPVAVCRFEHLLQIKHATGGARDAADCRRLETLMADRVRLRD